MSGSIDVGCPTFEKEITGYQDGQDKKQNKLPQSCPSLYPVISFYCPGPKFAA
jgi:hypothetical protein